MAKFFNILLKAMWVYWVNGLGRNALIAAKFVIFFMVNYELLYLIVWYIKIKFLTKNIIIKKEPIF